jgi:hypothetical protein
MTLLVASRANPMSIARQTAVVEPGLTIEQIVRRIFVDDWRYENAHVMLEDLPVERHRWAEITPADGSRLSITVIPEGGQDLLRGALMIAVVVAAVYTGQWYVGYAAIPGAAGAATAAGISGALTLAGALAVNALVPPAETDINDSSRDSPTYAITGTRNDRRPWERVPMVFGVHRMYPPIAAGPTFDIVDQDVYFRMILALGAGRIDTSDLEIKIGETPIDDYDDVEIETFDGSPGQTPQFTIYPVGRRDLEGGGEIRQDSGRVSRTTPTRVKRFIIEIVAPRGLLKFGKNTGDRIGQTEDFRFESRKVGEEAWFDHGVWQISGKQSTPVRRTYPFATTDQAYEGEWEIAVTRLTANEDVDTTADDTVWSALRVENDDQPVTLPGCAAMALRMRSSGQLAGVTDRVNVVAKVVTLDYDHVGDQWIERVSSNPAAALVRQLMHNFTEYRAAESEIDWLSMAEWHDYCRERDLRFDYIIDYKPTLFEALQLICTAGDATPGIVDGKWRVYIDQPQPVRHHVFSPRNARNFASEIVYYTQPDAVRVRFPNAELGYQADEIIVPSDGFTEETAETYETLEFPGKTRASEIQRRVRRRFAEVVMRDQVFAFQVDIEALTFEKGDRAVLQYDRVLAGVASGRVARLEVDGDNILSVELDTEAVLESGRQYGMAWRSPVNEAVQIIRIVTNVGKSAQLALETPMPVLDGIAFDDLIAVVEVSGAEVDGAEVIIKEILPGDNYGAQIIAVPYREEIYTPDTEPVPEWTSKLTPPPGTTTPVISAIYSDESVATRLPGGVIILRAIVSVFQNNTAAMIRADSIVLRWRDTDETETWTEITAPVDSSRIVLEPVRSDSQIAVQIRWQFSNGEAGPWSGVQLHQVEGVYLAPPDVTVVWQDGDLIRWEAPRDPDHAGWLVRWSSEPGTSWESAEPLSDASYQPDFISIEVLPQDAAEILVKAVTLSGMESVNAARSTVDFDLGIGRYALSIADFRAAGWPGDLYNAEVIDGVIRQLSSSVWLPAPGAVAFPDPNAPAFDLQWDEGRYEALWPVPSMAIGSDVVEIVTTRSQGARIMVQWIGDSVIEFADDDPIDLVLPNADPLPPDWLPFGTFGDPSTRPPVPYRGPVRVVPGETLRIIVIFPGGTAVRGFIEQLMVKLNARVIVDTLGGIGISASGTRVQTTMPVRVIIGVLALLHGDQPEITPRIMDKSDPVAGALIRVFNAAGQSVAATADVTITGA